MILLEHGKVKDLCACLCWDSEVWLIEGVFVINFDVALNLAFVQLRHGEGEQTDNKKET